MGLLGAGATIGLSGWLTAKAGHLRLTLYSYNSFLSCWRAARFFSACRRSSPGFGQKKF
ncbi:Hypothetical protein LBU_0202 [Lactobacillus delbrueckii subsp. bulgaricus 2038]|nr:Hypothetical protein LBU_0202 [Lactobacillus delbrueckii subsp. bulgaricus 2038]